MKSIFSCSRPWLPSAEETFLTRMHGADGSLLVLVLVLLLVLVLSFSVVFRGDRRVLVESFLCSGTEVGPFVGELPYVWVVFVGSIRFCEGDLFWMFEDLII